MYYLDSSLVERFPEFTHKNDFVNVSETIHIFEQGKKMRRKQENIIKYFPKL